jgi:heptosyltransferase I
MSPIALSSPPRRILIIKPSALGDIVHTLPILNLLRTRWPDAHISWLINPPFAGLIEDHPQLDEIILFERKRFARSWRDARAARALYHFARDLRQRNFDLVIDLQGLFRSGWLAAATRASLRVGFAAAREFAPVFYTHRVRVGMPEQHAIERYLTITQALGCGRGPVVFNFATTDADRADVAQLIAPNRRFAVLLPGTNWLTKRWPVEHFAQLVAPLRERFGLECIVAGGSDVVDLAPQIPGSINLANRTTLKQLTALLERAELVIANDSGPMHIAAALGRPLVTPFGPTNPIRTGPYQRLGSVIRLDIPCSPCYSRTCSHQSCLQWLTPAPVLTLAQQQMPSTTSGGSPPRRSVSPSIDQI